MPATKVASNRRSREKIADRECRRDKTLGLLHPLPPRSEVPIGSGCKRPAALAKMGTGGTASDRRRISRLAHMRFFFVPGR
jgi:hypothetical protein